MKIKETKPPVDQRLRSISDKTPMEEQILQVLQAAELLQGEIQRRAKGTIDRQRKERSELRQAILSRHQDQHGPGATIATSMYFTFLDYWIGKTDLGWSEMFRRRPKRGIKSKEHFRRIPMDTKSGHRPGTVTKDAHPDEYELLLEHEQELRILRARWKESVKIRRAIISQIHGLLKERLIEP